MAVINNGYMQLLDELIIDGKVIGHIAEEGIDWGGDKPSYLKLNAAQKRNGPVSKVLANNGTNIISFQMIQLVAENIANLAGGTVVGEKWNAPSTPILIEGPAQIKSGTGQTILIPKLSVSAVVRGKLGNTGNLYLDCEAEIMAPESGDPYSIGPTTPAVTVSEDALNFLATGGTQVVRISASGPVSLSAAPSGFTYAQDGNYLVITAAANAGAAKTGTTTITLVSDNTKTATIALTQNAGA